MQAPLQNLCSRLQGVRRNGQGWVARCPAHEDRQPSLSLNEGDDGRALVHCHAGCRTDDILAALGLAPRDLFAQRKRNLNHPRHGTPSRVWEIRDVGGRLFGVHARFDRQGGKQVLWHRNGRWGLHGTPLTTAPLYGSQRLKSFDSAVPVFVHEGEKATDAGLRAGLQSLGTVTGAGGTPGPEALEPLRGYQVVLWPDHDDEGRAHMERIGSLLANIAREVSCIDPRALGIPPKGDAAEWHAGREGRDRETLLKELLRHSRGMENASEGLIAIDWRELLSRDFPELEPILAPWVRKKTIAMVYGWRGTGKTWVSLGIATAVASGGSFLRWKAPKPRGVLLVDGEMPMQHLQSRTRQLIRGANTEPEARMRFLPADLQKRGLPNLATRDGQLQVEEHLDGVELVILDNLSTLFQDGPENESQSWSAAQEWMLSLRRRDLAIVFLHHAGKSGAQRGTSRREDVADVVLGLKRPADYCSSEGARFEVHFEKARGLYGPEAESFEVKLEARPGQGAVWAFAPLRAETLDQVVELTGQGWKQVEIAQELGIHPSNVSRAVQTARRRGILS